MTRIIIDDVDTIQDLYNALAAVTEAFSDPDTFDSEEQYFAKSSGPHVVGSVGRADQETLDIEPPRLVDGRPSRVKYVPCPRRGTHHRLSECWACWCDVQLGACLESDVLAPEAWDVALEELVAGASPTRRGARLSATTRGDGFDGGGEQCAGV